MTRSRAESMPLKSGAPRAEELQRLVDDFSRLPDSESEAALDHLLSTARELVREYPSEQAKVAAILRPLDLPSKELQRLMNGDSGPSTSKRETRPLTFTESAVLSSVWVPFFALTVAVVIAALAIGVALTYLALTASSAWALFFTNGYAAKVACNASTACASIGLLFTVELVVVMFTPFALLADQSRRDVKKIIAGGNVEILSGAFEKRCVMGRGKNLSLVLGDQVIALNSVVDRNQWVYDRVPDAAPTSVGLVVVRPRGGFKGRGWLLEVDGARPPKPVRVGLRHGPSPEEDE